MSPCNYIINHNFKDDHHLLYNHYLQNNPLLHLNNTQSESIVANSSPESNSLKRTNLEIGEREQLE